MTDSLNCPCGSGLDYEQCCGKLHAGKKSAESAEQLMRSRYTAFVKGQSAYLVDTLHPSKRTPQTETAVAQTMDTCHWVRLNILETEAPSDSEGVVEFIAAFETDSPDLLHERSRFVKENGNWYYLDAIPPQVSRPGRNEPCWCGSGKKTKKCHG